MPPTKAASMWSVTVGEKTVKVEARNDRIALDKAVAQVYGEDCYPGAPLDDSLPLKRVCHIYRYLPWPEGERRRAPHPTEKVTAAPLTLALKKL